MFSEISPIEMDRLHAEYTAFVKPFVEYRDLDEKKKDILVNGLMEETAYYVPHQGSRESLERYLDVMVFHFTTVRPEKIPKSVWENNAEEEHVKKIREISTSILERGFDNEHPIIIHAHIELSDIIHEIIAGNHRAQAVKELLKEGKIPPTFPVPVIFKLHCAVKMNFDGDYLAKTLLEATSGKIKPIL